jgi:hypothetical protein
MAGTVTVTSMSNPEARDGANKVIIDWISTAAGAADGALCTLFSAARLATFGYAFPQPSKFRGKLIRVATAPGLNGDLATALPTAGYDLTLTATHGTDVCSGYIKDRSGTLGEQWVPAQPVAVDTELTLNVSNAGDTKKGRVILYFEKGM